MPTRRRLRPAPDGGAWRPRRHHALLLLVGLTILGLHSLLGRRPLSLGTPAMRSSDHHQRAMESPLLDGRPIGRRPPQTFPNGEPRRFACDLPSLRYQCGLDPHAGCRGYPQLFPSGELMRHWSPADPTPPSSLKGRFESICRFDVSSPYELALATVFHQMEVPFIAYGIPELDAARETWTDEYLTRLLGPKELYKVHVANSSHFMFYSKHMATDSRPPPYESKWWTYSRFLEERRRAQPDDGRRPGPYVYLMLKADDIRQRAAFVLDELGFLDPRRPHPHPLYGELFLRDPAHARAKGMRCRLGMRGIITEGHVDSGLNVVAMIRGHKRYILSPPSVCRCLGLLRDGPSMRHTAVDWATVRDRADPVTAKHYDCPATEVLVGPGDVLYIPSYWYHHIVSVDDSIQCNIRSGILARPDVREALDQCGLVGI